MDWVKWLIPLVVVFVIILSNLARITQEERKRLPPRRRPGEGDLPPRPRRTPSEIDRFLEEVNRRRRQASEPRKPAVKEQRPVPRRPAVERPARRETPSPDQDIPSVVPPTQRSPAPVSTPVVLMPTRQRPAVIEQAVVQEVVVAQRAPLPAAAPSAAEVGTAAPAIVAVRPATPVAAHLRQLLKNPQTLKTAFVLREILDGPLCRRPQVAPGRRRGT